MPAKPGGRKATSSASKSSGRPAAKGKPAAASAATAASGGGGALPAVGQAAPDFTAPAVGPLGDSVTLSALRGRPVVLYFYPKDGTSGCTVEACGFRDAWPALGGVAVLGVSPDGPASHARFIAKFQLPFTLLADADHALAAAYGVWQEKSMYGRKYMGVVRTTFVIDAAGRIAHVFEKVKPAGHADEVQAVLKTLR